METNGTTCLNCEAELGAGKYCPQCGQKRVSLRPTLHDFLHEAFHEFLHFDGKIVQTMKVLTFSPGQITRDFVDGKRTRYISPLRLYLLWSVVYFAMVATFGIGENIVQIHSGQRKAAPPVGGVHVDAPPSSPEMRARMEKNAKEIEQHPEVLAESIAHSVPKAMFVLMPFFAWLIFLFFRRREPFYIPHLYFSIHLHAFTFFLFSIVALLSAAKTTVTTVVSALLTFLVLPYFYFALRTVYGSRRWETLWKGALVFATYFVMLMLTIGLVVFLTLAR